MWHEEIPTFKKCYNSTLHFISTFANDFFKKMKIKLG